MVTLWSSSGTTVEGLILFCSWFFQCRKSLGLSKDGSVPPESRDRSTHREWCYGRVTELVSLLRSSGEKVSQCSKMYYRVFPSTYDHRGQSTRPEPRFWKRDWKEKKYNVHERSRILFWVKTPGVMIERSNKVELLVRIHGLDTHKEKFFFFFRIF